MRFLYSRHKGDPVKNGEGLPYELKVFQPKLGRLMLPGERWSVKAAANRLIFQIATRGKARVFYVEQEGQLVHTSYVVPRCGKFPFLQESDFEIGPCYTYPQFRGKGVYPQVLCGICRELGDSHTTFYMIVSDTNLPSIKGVEKAGFQTCGSVEVSRLFKRYRRIELPNQVR